MSFSLLTSPARSTSTASQHRHMWASADRELTDILSKLESVCSRSRFRALCAVCGGRTRSAEPRALFGTRPWVRRTQPRDLSVVEKLDHILQTPGLEGIAASAASALALALLLFRTLTRALPAEPVQLAAHAPIRHPAQRAGHRHARPRARLPRGIDVSLIPAQRFWCVALSSGVGLRFLLLAKNCSDATRLAAAASGRTLSQIVAEHSYSSPRAKHVKSPRASIASSFHGRSTIFGRDGTQRSAAPSPAELERVDAELQTMLRSPVSVPAREAVSPPPAPAPAEPPPRRPAPQPLEAPQPSTVTPRLDPVVLNRSEREHAITLRHEEEYAANRGLTWNGIGCASLPRPPHIYLHSSAPGFA